MLVRVRVPCGCQRQPVQAADVQVVRGGRPSCAREIETCAGCVACGRQQNCGLGAKRLVSIPPISVARYLHRPNGARNTYSYLRALREGGKRAWRGGGDSFAV